MDIRYLFNSGFCITDGCINVIFDYFLDSCDDEHILQNGVVGDDLLLREGKLYVLSSHSHSDHFNRIVLEWNEKKDDITYIFSKDIRQFAAGSIDISDIHFLQKTDEFENEHLFVKAFGSTDEGISFLVRFKESGLVVFHAGDLNNWHWLEESTQREAEEAQNAYLAELEQIKAETDYFDVVMFPVDPRLGKEYMLGGKQFLNEIKCGLFVPMHFGEKYEASWEFEKYARLKGSEFARITARGDKFNYKTEV